MTIKQNIVVLGASPKPQRFSNQAVRRLLAHGYNVIPVHPMIQQIESLQVFSSLNEIKQKIDTITLYISAEKSEQIVDEIVAANPDRVIFNPGTESELVKNRLINHGVRIVEDCTLIMLDTGRF